MRVELVFRQQFENDREYMKCPFVCVMIQFRVRFVINSCWQEWVSQ